MEFLLFASHLTALPIFGGRFCERPKRGTTLQFYILVSEKEALPFDDTLLGVEQLWGQDEVITSTFHFSLSVFWCHMSFVSQQL